MEPIGSEAAATPPVPVDESDFSDRRTGRGAPVVLVVDGAVPAVITAVRERTGWRVVSVAADNAVEVIGWVRPDLAVLAIDAGQELDEVLLCALIDHPRMEWVPVIVVAHDPPAHLATIALNLGARDVLNDRQSVEEVEAHLRAANRTRAQLVGLARRNRELDDLAGVDVLTDLPNRRRLDEQLRVIEAAASRRGETLGILLVDIDNFKLVNDTYGHHVGDEVLRAVAARLRAALRAEDTMGRIAPPTVGRWAGDEFIVGVAAVNEEGLAQIGDRLRTLVGARPIETLDGPTPSVTVTVSVGGATALAEPWPALLQHADEALYRVKQAGRNAVNVLPAPH